MVRCVVAFFLTVASAAAQTPDVSGGSTRQDPPYQQVRAGYQRLHAGDKADALRLFEEELKRTPDDLQLRLGSLAARREQIRDDETLVPAYERDLDALIELADRRYGRSGRDADAHRTLSAAYLLRAEYRYEHKGMWGAARDAAKAKDYAERYVTQHPEHGDAYLPLGLYNYFVDIAPAFAKVMRFLLFLPAGDRAAGLQQIERAAAQGDLMAPFAQQTLVDIYSFFEGRPADAVRLAERLRERFPENDSFAMTAGGVFAGPALEDHDRAADVYVAIIRRRQNDVSPDGAASRYRATIALASERVDQGRTQDAIAILTGVIDANVRKPEWVAPLSLLRRGNFRALLNDAGAADDLRRVQNEFKKTEWPEHASSLLRWAEKRRASGEAADFAALIPGQRLAAERRWNEARQHYEAVLAQRPESAWARYRLAAVRFRTEPPEQSMSAFSALATNKRTLPTVRGLALLHIARIHDLTGRRAEALKVYRQVADDFEDDRSGELAQIGLITPYQQPQ
jgi:tetratricopeptide (TPR) repeat protein